MRPGRRTRNHPGRPVSQPYGGVTLPPELSAAIRGIIQKVLDNRDADRCAAVISSFDDYHLTVADAAMVSAALAASALGELSREEWPLYLAAVVQLATGILMLRSTHEEGLQPDGPAAVSPGSGGPGSPH